MSIMDDKYELIEVFCPYCDKQTAIAIVKVQLTDLEYSELYFKSWAEHLNNHLVRVLSYRVPSRTSTGG